MKKIYFLLFTLITTLSFGQSVVITGYVDSPCPSQFGRTVEIYIDGTVDLTGWSLVRQSNGGGFTSSTMDISALGTLTDTFAYITNNEAALNTEFGINTNFIVNSNINDNGDDAFQLVNNVMNIIDRFGEDNVDGTGTAWEHLDSYYYRKDGVAANAGVFLATDFTYGGNNLLDTKGLCNPGPEATALSADVPFGTYSPIASLSPTILVSGPLTGMNYITGTGPSPEKSFTVSGSNLTEDISINAPANFEISNTSGGTFSISLSLRQTAGSVASTTIYVRLMAGMPIAEHTGTIDLTSNGANGKSVSVTGNVFPAATNALVITGVFDANITGLLSGSSPRGVELMALENIPDLSIFGVESANNGASAIGQEFTFPAVAATKGEFFFIVGTGQETDFTNYFGATFTANYASNAMFINGNDAIVLYENTYIIDAYGEVGIDGTGTAWDYLDGWGYRIAGTGPSATFNVADWQVGNVGELEQATNSASSTPYPIKLYTNVLGISKQQLKDGFALYPNPVRGGIVSIQSKSNSVKNISIFDVVGKQVYQKTTSASQINISQLKTGIYFVKVVQDGKIATRKLVVQ